jgi:hypothetical protein
MVLLPVTRIHSIPHVHWHTHLPDWDYVTETHRNQQQKAIRATLAFLVATPGQSFRTRHRGNWRIQAAATSSVAGSL